MSIAIPDDGLLGISSDPWGFLSKPWPLAIEEDRDVIVLTNKNRDLNVVPSPG
ncbi:MAG: hypothetical protein AAGG44_10415 [Planctomycetota bacterium]